MAAEISSAVLADYQYYKRAFAGRAMPFAYLDLDALGANLRTTVARAGAKRIRIASKSVRCRGVLARVLQANPQFQGIMCYTAAEAVWLSGHGFDDLLVGYPTRDTAQIRAVCAALRAGKTIVLMVDAAAHIADLAALAASEGVTLPLCLDIDLALDVPGLHFGVWRSAVRSVADALAVYATIARYPQLRLDGVMGYEAQVAGVGDTTPGQGAKNALIRVLKRRSVALAARRRAAIVGALRDRGAALRLVNGGGTGSLESTTREACITEVTVGSGIFAPTLFDAYAAFRYQPAAGFAIPIVRQPRPDIYTCLGGGYVASGSAGPEKLPQPFLPAGARLLPLEGAGEVQTPVIYTGPELLQPGDPIFMRHAKAGELCEHFNTLLLVAGGAVVGELPTYRGEGMAFL